jgi:glyoxylase-like metal-dependent hydrolase (beta-lactamase superfamily II)
MIVQDPPVQIADNLWMLGANEYPLYLVRGEGDAAIIEGGVGAMGPLVLEQMEKLGIRRESIRQLVIPHAHPDHVMAVPLLRETLPEVTVVASEIAAGTLAHEKAISMFLAIDQALTESLLKRGRITEAGRPKPLEEKKIAVDKLVGEGDAVEVDGLSFRVLKTPGHSDCSLSFHEPNQGILFVSDAAGYYMPDHDAWWPDYFAGYRAFLDSMERLAALGAGTLCLGHSAVVTGAEAVQAHFRRAMEATRAYHQRIVDEVKSGKPIRQLAESLGVEVYEKTPLLPLEFFQKNCNLLVKQSLKHEGITVEE